MTKKDKRAKGQENKKQKGKCTKGQKDKGTHGERVENGYILCSDGKTYKSANNVRVKNSISGKFLLKFYAVLSRK